MDSRTAGHVLSRIADYLQLRGESAFKSRAYAGAAKEVRALGVDDLAPLYRSGELGKIRGLGPAILSVIGDLIESIEELEAVVVDGRLVRVLRIGPKTVERILNGIAMARARGSFRSFHHAL